MTINIIVKPSCQQLLVQNDDQTLASYAISTGINGLGEQRHSECTPRGWHIIRAKIGAGYPMNTVFKGRRPTGEIFSPELARQYPDRDWVLSRILWLSGLEIGKNRLGNVDTMRRFIYIHGCPDEVIFGEPTSKGCIRMHNADVIELFDRVPIGTRVYIAP